MITHITDRERAKDALILQLSAGRDKLAARVEALEADAARYRQLRRGQRWSIIGGMGDELRAEALDAAIDAALTEKQT